MKDSPAQLRADDLENEVNGLFSPSDEFEQKTHFDPEDDGFSRVVNELDETEYRFKPIESESGMGWSIAVEFFDRIGSEGEERKALPGETKNTILNGVEPEEYYCNLCAINAPQNYGIENIFKRYSDGTHVVQTYDKKGHKVRNMLVYSEHGEIPSQSGQSSSADLEFEISNGEGGSKEVNALKDGLFKQTAREILENEDTSDQLTVYVGLNSEPGHYHLVASDVDPEIGGDESIDDLESVQNFIYWDLSNYSEHVDLDEVFQNPDVYRIENDIGEECLEPQYEEAAGKDFSLEQDSAFAVS